MSLTGPVFLDGIIAVTIAAFAAVVWLWPRLTGRSPWHVVGRVGALGLVNLLVLLTAATQLNATYLFFSGWSDLSGALTGHLAQTAVHRGGNQQAAPDVALAGAAPVAARVPPLTVPMSRTGLLTYTVQGGLSGLTGTVLVQLPPGYTAATAQRYPVIEAFGGYPSIPLGWIRVFHIDQTVNELVTAHKLRPPVIVMPQIEFPTGVDTEGVNGPAGDPQIETWLTRDVPEWVGQHFRVIPKRNAWATIGYSTGGFVAAMSTILHPAQYGAGIAFGGYFKPEFGSFYRPFTSTSRLARHYDLIRAEARRHPPVSLWLETSHADPVSYPSTAQFLKATSKPTAVQAVILKDAGHRDSIFQALVPQALTWLGQNVQGFRPTVGGGPSQETDRATATKQSGCHYSTTTLFNAVRRIHRTQLNLCGVARRSATHARSAGARPRPGGRRPTRAAR